jgi:lysophospholipase L1-like esterase
MLNKMRWGLIIIPIFILSLLFGGFLFFFSFKNPSNPSSIPQVPNPKMPEKTGEKVKYSQDFVIVLVGDSMTEKLGNSDELRANLKKNYPGKTFEVLNYSFGSTNILSVPDRLQNKTFYGREFRPILDIDFDLIVIESFGHNPLSQYPLKEGLQKTNETLDKIVSLIKTSNPNAKIAFLATIAPNKQNYAKGQVELSSEKRAEWAEERTAYIKNHIEYARSHNIPIINVFEKSLDKYGDGNLTYINSDDNIHPSPSGVYFISDLIGNFIFENKLF